MKSKIVIWTTLICGCLGVMGCQKGPGKKAEYAVKMIKDKLDLNQEQIQKLDAVKSEFLLVRSKKKESRDKKFDQMKQVLLSEKIDRSELEQTIKAHHDERKKDYSKVIDLAIEFHASLSPEQKQKAVALVDKFREKLKKKWSH